MPIQAQKHKKNEVRLRNIKILVSYGVAIFQKDLGRIKERESTYE